MQFKPLKIGKHLIEKPIVQGGMGLGISWDRLAGSVSREGGLGVISSVGTGLYENRAYVDRLMADGRPYEVENFFSRKALFKIFENQLVGNPAVFLVKAGINECPNAVHLRDHRVALPNFRPLPQQVHDHNQGRPTVDATPLGVQIDELGCLPSVLGDWL